jgi:glucose-1-phosphate adenylyltransferase
MNEFVDLLPAQQRVDEAAGTAARPTRSTRTRTSWRVTGADYIVVLAGDHIYKMNYALMLADHVAKGALHRGLHRGAARGGHGLRRDGRSMPTSMITDFVEKPADPPAMPGKPDMSLASMGIYIFNARYLYAELERDMADPNSSHDFGKDIIPRAVRAGGVAAAHPFDLSCVWRPRPAGSPTGATWARSTPTGTPTST